MIDFLLKLWCYGLPIVFLVLLVGAVVMPGTDSDDGFSDKYK